MRAPPLADITHAMDISLNTVKTHAKAILSKIGIPGALEAQATCK